MSDQVDKLQKDLTAFGLSIEEAAVYLRTVALGPTTALKLSKELRIPRSKIYRLLDKLLEKGFVKQEIKGYGNKFTPENYEKLENILTERERDLATLKSKAPNIYQQLILLQTQTKDESHILNYRGIEGLKQVTWNSTKVEGDFRIYEVSLLHAVVDDDFAEKTRREFAKKPTNRFYQLTNAKSFPAYTKVTEHIKQWHVRHVPQNQLDITFEIQIYNDVYCMFEYTDEDVFIVEVYNQNLAQMQKQIFDFVWRYAKPMKILDAFGAAKLA